MKVYAIAHISVGDVAGYARYIEGVLPTLSRYNGQLLAADEGPVAVEGAWGRLGVVVMAFDERHDFERWSTSDEYCQISKGREASTDRVVLLVRGA